MEACCTCATVLNPPDDEKPEKVYRGPSVGRRLPCCPRMMCGDCLHENPRFETYCPYCQVSSEPSLLPQGLKAPPSYTAKPVSSRDFGLPPPYSKSNGDVNPQSAPGASSTEYNEKEPVDDTLHFLNHDHDSITSLSLRYGVPAAALRQKNNIASDHLLLGRKTILIPGDYYRGGVSLSPRPVEGEDEELRKQKIRRFMTTSKVADYDIALLYLENARYNLDTAVEAHFADEEWERKHPRELSRKGRIDQGSFLRRK